MPDREKVINSLNESIASQHCGFIDGVGDVYAVSGETITDAIALLKEQEEQKRKWLQTIADTQLAVSPTGYETEVELAKRTGEWNGLQMAWDILMEGR